MQDLPQPMLIWEGLQAPACYHLGRASLIGHAVPSNTQLSATPEYHSLTARSSVLLNSLCHNSVYVGPHKSQVLINLCLQRPRGDKVSEALTRQNQIDTAELHRRTWYLSYTTGRVNIDTTAEEKKSTVLNSCWSDSSREETYFKQQQTYGATWSADPPGIFVLKINFAQISQIWVFHSSCKTVKHTLILAVWIME